MEFRGISQTGMYTSGAYTGQVLLAMRERQRIDAILAGTVPSPKPPALRQPAGSAAGCRPTRPR